MFSFAPDDEKKKVKLSVWRKKRWKTCDSLQYSGYQWWRLWRILPNKIKMSFCLLCCSGNCFSFYYIYHCLVRWLLLSIRYFFCTVKTKAFSSFTFPTTDAIITLIPHRWFWRLHMPRWMQAKEHWNEVSGASWNQHN